MNLTLPGVGAEAVVKSDLKLAARYQTNFGAIELRFKNMPNDLGSSYSNLSLPQVLTTSDVPPKL